LALSGGPAAAYAPVGAGARAAIAEYNATAGSGVKLELIQADDQFQPDKAIAAAQKLIQQNNVTAMTSVIGDPSVLAVRSTASKASSRPRIDPGAPAHSSSNV
jgi:branched-chain amino acid transport system substrate-binding protein